LGGILKGLERSKGGHTDVAANHTSQCAYQIVHHTWGSTAYRISYSHSVDTGPIDGLVEGEDVDEVGSERILGRETHFDSLRLDVFNDLESSLLNNLHALSMRVFPQETACPDNEVYAIHSAFNLMDGLAVMAGKRTGKRRRRSVGGHLPPSWHLPL
jgi:hypothetical protein